LIFGWVWFNQLVYDEITFQIALSLRKLLYNGIVSIGGQGLLGEDTGFFLKIELIIGDQSPDFCTLLDLPLEQFRGLSEV
jgi:hypothetical protein